MKQIKGIKTIRESFKTRQVKYGGYAALLTLAVIAGLVLLNLITGQLPLQLDLTANRLFSLSEQTVQVLESVKSPVKFYGLWRPGEEDKAVLDVINLYLSRNRNIGFELIDPDRNPGFVVRYDRDKRGIPRGSLIIEGEKGFKVIAPADMYDISQTESGGSVTGVSVERRITNALLFAGMGSTPVVYELTGHMELSLAQIGLQDTVENENYSLKSLNLLLSEIPADTSAIIINNPMKDLSTVEADKLLNYLEKGGRLLALADYKIEELTNLNMVLASYGLEYNYGIVHETDPFYVALDPRTEWPDLTDHDITRPLADKTLTPVIMLEPMSISVLETRRNSLEISPLMTSSSASFLRTNIEETSSEKLPEDIAGPLMLGAAVIDLSAAEGSEARLVAISSGNLLLLAGQGFDANRDIFMNSLTWLEDRPENITVRSKSLYLLPLRMNLAEVIIFGILFILVIPLSFFAAGFITWLKRRHL